MDLPSLIAAIDARTDADERRLAGAMLERAWPGGCADLHRPAAAEWVRRWMAPPKAR